jgi:ATP-dependent DNA helicase DinG
VHDRLPEEIRRLVLMQGAMAKSELLGRHRAAVDRGEPSVLFGLQSLAEGVDLPGDYCTHVVCAKLPFSVPDSPLEEARREWIEAQGRSSFMEITLPETAVKLKQQLGRLLRTCEDRGTVTILDRRLVSKRWGALLMKGLPDFRVVIEPRPRVSATRDAETA